MTLTDEQKRWLDGLKRHLGKMPPGIELLVSAGVLHAHPAGWYVREIYETDVDMLLAGEVIESASLYRINFDRKRIRPNSEGE